MTTQTILTVAGYAVGSYFGYPQLGAFVGAAVGYALQPDLPTQRGPRMDDRRVQVSTYGVSIPLAYGAVRFAGNVIWARDLEEVETDTEVGAKGGPSQSQITYSYYGTFAVLLSKNYLRGVRRIWCDAVLVYDGTVDAPLSSVAFQFYRGTEDQLPDPTIEATEGVGNVPAYRGFAYIVFDRLPLEQFGNRLPSVSVEVIGDGEWQATASDIGPAGAVPYGGAAQRLDGMIVAVSEPAAGSMRLDVRDPATGAVVASADHVIDFEWASAFLKESAVSYIPPTNEVWVTEAGVGIERFNADTLAHVGSLDIGGWFSAVTAYEPTLKHVVIHRSSSQIGSDSMIFASLDGQYEGLALPGGFFCGQLVTGGSAVFLACNALNRFYVFKVASPFTMLASHATPSTGNLGVWDSLRNRYAVFGQSGTDGAVWTVSDSDPPVIELTVLPDMFATASPNAAQYLPGLDVYAVWTSVVGIAILTIIDAETLEVLLDDLSVSGNSVVRAFASPDDPGRAFVIGTLQPYNVQLYGTTVGATVQSLCQQSGLAPADIDVSELTQTLRGFLVSQFAPARSAIEQLGNAFLFEGAEQDDVIYFRRRGGATVATITAAECGAGVDQAADHAISRTRAQEADLPRKLFVSAPDPLTDHQPGTQYAERQAANAGEDEQIQMAVVLGVDENRRLADALLFDRWASRGRRSWATTRKHARLVPSDPVMLDGERVRILSRSDEGSVIRWEGVVDDADVVVQTIAGVQGSFPGQTVSVTVPTTLLFLDIALLRDADDGPGAYVAAYGPPPWRGAVLYASADGIGWERVLTLPSPGSAIGIATNALGDWAGPNVFDESNRLTVSLYIGSAASTTRLGVLNGGNALAIEGADGWEVLQYRDALLEDDGTWTLTGLLRGRRGTEFAMGGHAAGDRVVLLSTTAIRDLAIDSALIGIERPYRAVSIGDTIANTPERDETISAERLVPLSPVQLGGGRTGAGDLLMQFRRRTRVGGEWRDSVDASLGEDSEAYEVDVFTSAARTTVVRTIAGLSTPSATYTAAQQTTDFGSPQAPVYWAAYQLSATVGRGHVAHGTT